MGLILRPSPPLPATMEQTVQDAQHTQTFLSGHHWPGVLSASRPSPVHTPPQGGRPKRLLALHHSLGLGGTRGTSKPSENRRTHSPPSLLPVSKWLG